MRVPGWIVPVLVTVVTASSLLAARLLAIPSLAVHFRSPAPGSRPTVSVFVVDGVRCVDTARRAASALAEIEGVLGVVAYASRSRLDITFDHRGCSPTAIRDALEGPILDEESGSFLFGQFRVVEIDGRPIGR